MPYIPKSQRKIYEKELNSLIKILKSNNFNAGDLNYVISTIMGHNFNSHPSYAKINDIMGCLESIKSEFYYRLGRPYEEIKLQLNGDIDVFIKK